MQGGDHKRRGRRGDATEICSDAVDESGLQRSSAPVKPHKGAKPKGA